GDRRRAAFRGVGGHPGKLEHRLHLALADARRGGAEQGPYLVEELVHVFAPLLKRFGGLRRLVRWLPSSLLRRAGRSFAAPQSSQRAAPATSLRPAGSAHRPPALLGPANARLGPPR